jgi:hypothetical protein
MSRAACKIIVTCTSVGLFAATTWAQDRSETAALQLIRETAADICTTAPMEGADSRVELSGSAKAKLDGAISKVVNLGLEGAAKYQAENYKSVLQSDLARAIKDANDCKLAVFNTLVNRMLPPPDTSSGVNHKPLHPVPHGTAPDGSTELDGEYAYRNTHVTQGSGGCNIRDDSVWKVYRKNRDLLLYRRLFHHFDDSPSCSREEYFICASALRIIPISTSINLQSGLSFDTVSSGENRANRATGLSTIYYLDSGILVNSTEAIARCAKKVPTSGFKGMLARKSPLQLVLSGPALEAGVVLTKDEGPRQSPSPSLQLPR